MFNIHKFSSVEEFNAVYKGDGYSEPWVSHTDGGGVDYNKKKYEPLTFNILSNGEIGWKANSSSADSARTIQYSKNGGEWTDITSTTGGATIPVVTGDVLKFKGDAWPGSSQSPFSYFTSTCTFEASGNPGSLKYGEVTYGDEPLADYCYRSLFRNCSGLIKVPELPATTLANSCYLSMFENCTGLTSAPELPATTLLGNSCYGCYESMFYGCTSLVVAPTLPATTLAPACYYEMFSGCTSLITAPTLPATTLLYNCYKGMFENCTSLINIPTLPATTLTSSCYMGMFSGCTSITTAPELPATTLALECYYNMFKNCTSLTTAPDLPATTLQTSCYYSMFEGCTSLINIPSILPATVMKKECYYRMFYGCTSITAGPELPDITSFTTRCGTYMFYGCTNLNYMKAMFVAEPEYYDGTWWNSAFGGWLSLTGPGTFIKNQNALWPGRRTTNAGQFIPDNWTIQTVSA